MPFKIPRPAYDAEVVAAIEEHLELDRLTELEFTDNLGHPDDGLKVFHAVGSATRVHNRPMLQVLSTEAFSCTPLPVRPCPDCDDWARSWKCEKHHELPYDTETKAWVRPELEVPVVRAGPAYSTILAALEGAMRSDIRERPAYRLLNPITDAEIAEIRASIRESREDTRETAVRVAAETDQGHQAFEFRAERRGG